MSMQKVSLKLPPPWITYINILTALFDPDPMIAINVQTTTEKDPSVTLAVGGNSDKATAIQKILPSEKQFGNITLKINVDGKFTNKAFTSAKKLFDAAFENNPVYAYSIASVNESYQYSNITYVVFKNCVVQFFNDNLNDCHGVVSTLYENIANQLFKEYVEDFTGEMIYFNTDIETGKLGKHLLVSGRKHPFILNKIFEIIKNL